MNNNIPAKYFVQILAANVGNDEMTDKSFRELVANTLPQIEAGTIHKRFLSDTNSTGVRVYKQVVEEEPKPVGKTKPVKKVDK